MANVFGDYFRNSDTDEWVRIRQSADGTFMALMSGEESEVELEESEG